MSLGNLGSFHSLPNEMFFYLSEFFTPKDFLNFRKSHPIIGNKFSKLDCLRHFHKRAPMQAQTKQINYFTKNLELWGTLEMLHNGKPTDDAKYKAFKQYTLRGKERNICIILTYCPDISFESNFLLRWAYRRNYTVLVEYICGRTDFDISVDDYNCMSDIARYFVWPKAPMLKYIIPLAMEFELRKLFQFSCYHDNPTVFRYYYYEYLNMESFHEEFLDYCIQYDSKLCICIIIHDMENRIPFRFLQLSADLNRRKIFEKLLRTDDIRPINVKNQNLFLTQIGVRGNLKFMTILKDNNFEFENILDLIGVYALTIFHNRDEMFAFLLTYYPLNYSNHRCQYLLYLCVTFGSDTLKYFHKLIEMGCEPVPIRHCKVVAMSDYYSTYGDDFSIGNGNIGNGNRKMLLSKKREIRLTKNDYYVFYTDYIFIPALHETISFLHRITHNYLYEKTDDYFEEFTQNNDSEKWTLFNEWLMRGCGSKEGRVCKDNELGCWKEATDPSPLFSKEITFNIFVPHLTFSQKNKHRQYFIEEENM